MATTLRDFITHRESEIREQMRLLRSELADLKKAKAALEPPQGDGTIDQSEDGGPTIKDMIRTVLSGEHIGVNSSDILVRIERAFGRKLERTSLSPQLSRLRKDGEVSSFGSLWSLTEKGQAHIKTTSEAVEPEQNHNPEEDAAPDVALPWDDDDDGVPF